MEINDYRPKQGRLHKTAASEYEASQVKAQQIKPSVQNYRSAQISKNEHSIIKGEIIDLRYQEVKVRLEPSGQIINAKLSGEVPLSIGQMAEFIVADEAEGLITLRYVISGSLPINDIIHKALYASGITASERNLAIVQELLNYQMPVDKNTILQLIKLTSTYPDVNPATLILMLKNKLPINIGNIAQFEAYQDGTHQILTQLKAIIENINTITSDNNIQGKHQAIQNDTTGYNDVAYNSTTHNTDAHNVDEHNATTHDDAAHNTTTHNANNSESMLSTNAIGYNTDNTIISQSDIQSDYTALNNMINLHKELLTLLIDGEGRQAQVFPDTAIGKLLSDNELTLLQDTLLSKIHKVSYFNEEVATNVEAQLSDSTITLEGLLSIIHDLYKGDSSQAVTSSSMLTTRIAELFVGISEYMSDANKEKLVDLLKSEGYREIITEALYNRWTLESGELINQDKVKGYFKRLEKDMEELDKLTEGLKLPTSSVFKAAINKLQDNLQFMRDLNELFLYLQLPVRLTGQDVHGDLYVFTHKNQRHRVSESLSVLLHLDMVNLGSVDVHISMLNNQANAIFYVDKEAEQIIAQHLYELIDSLSIKGFKLQAKTQISDSKPDFITDILQQDTPAAKAHRYSFDIRA